MASFKLRVGGIYLLTGREPLALRIVAIEGDSAFYVHREPDGNEFGASTAPPDILSEQLTPGDQSPIPKIREALERMLEMGDDIDAVRTELREVLAWTA